MNDIEMKSSRFQWIGDIPKDWDIIRLKYVSRFKTGSTPSNKVGISDVSEQSIPWYTAPDFSENFVLDETNQFISNEIVDMFKLKIFPKDTILLVCIASVGKIGITKYVSYSNQQITGIMPFDIHPKYLLYLLFSQTDKIQKDASANVVPIINTQYLTNIPVTKPTLLEQKLIASFLDQKCSNIDSIINDLEKQIEILERYKKSVITEAVTKGLNPDVEMKDSGIKWIGNIPKHWDVSKVYRVCKIIRGNSAFQKDDLKNEGDYIGLQYGKTYKVNEVNEEYNYYVDSSFYKFNQVIINGYTIMVSTSETMEDLGHSCYYNRNDIGLLGGEQLALVPSEIFIGKFLYYASRYFKIELNQFASGIKVYRYKVSDLKNVNVIIPTLHEQTEIISFLDKKCDEIDSIIKDKKNQLEIIKKYKNSLIYEYVTGKKRVSQGDVNEKYII